MKKKLTFLILIVLIVFIVFELFYVLSNNDDNSSNVNNSQDVNLVNKNGEYEIANGSYVIGQNIPVGEYEVISKSDDAVVSIITEEGSKDLSSVQQGDTVELVDSDLAISVANGSLVLK